MKLSHYSQAPLTLEDVRAWAPREIEQRPFKPTGLWVSVDGPCDWAEWCQSEGFGLNRYLFRQEVTLSGNIRKLYDRMGSGGVLLIDSALDLNCFSEIYETRTYAVTGMASINWERVQSNYDGIIIAPYQWSCRMDLMWYYPWDCASGCVWSTDVIQGIGASEPIKWEERSYSDDD